MRNLTTAIIVKSPHLPVNGLFQQSLHQERLLHYMDIVHSNGICDDSIAGDMARHFVADAIRYSHTSAVKWVFRDQSFDEQFGMPALEVLEPLKTSVHLLSAMFENEATITGTARVHEELFLRQLHLGQDVASCDINETSQDDAYLNSAPEFVEQLFLAYGDQLTAARVRSVKSGQRNARRAFHRRNWLLSPPVWFHTMQALLLLIVRTHWEPSEPGKYSRATLVHDITYLTRHGINRDNVKYHQMQPLVTQGFRARISALFYRSLSRSGHLSQLGHEATDGSHRTYDKYDEAIRQLTPDEFSQHVDFVCKTALSREAWSGASVEDHEFVTMCRFLQEALLFLELQHAVKFGDIGLLRRLVDPLAVLFYGGDQVNYGFEMLHLRWLLLHSDLELQHVVLAGGLVNEQGKADTFKPIDLVLEHVNLGFARDMKALKNSTHDVVSTFIRGSLAHDELRHVREAFELNYGYRTNSAHTYKSAVSDVFNLAVHLDSEACTMPRVSLDPRKQFLSRDIFTVGLEAMPAKVLKFNADVPRSSNDSNLASEAMRLAISEAERGKTSTSAGSGDEVNNLVLDAVNIAEQEYFLHEDVGEVLHRRFIDVADASSAGSTTARAGGMDEGHGDEL